jgi:hypothetical protein
MKVSIRAASFRIQDAKPRSQLYKAGMVTIQLQGSVVCRILLSEVSEVTTLEVVSRKSFGHRHAAFTQQTTVTIFMEKLPTLFKKTLSP